MFDGRTYAARFVLPLIACISVSTPSYARGSPADAPPPGITPTTVKLQTVLDANDAAVGSSTHRSITNVDDGTIQAYGLSGRFHDSYAGLHSGDDYHSTLVLGPLTWQEGRFKGQQWHRNENGITTNLHPDYSSEGSDVRLLAEEAENPKNDRSLLGEVTDPVSAYVVQIKRKGEAPSWFFYDKQTALLDRIEIGYSDERHVITLDDYRSANGLKVAWHTHETTIGNDHNDWDSRTTKDEYGLPVAPSEFRIPSSNPYLLEFPAQSKTVALPARMFFGGDVIVRVSINGRGLDMLLDSASPGMLLDAKVARDLQLSTYGARARGSDQGDIALIGNLTIGDIVMRNVFVSCEPFYYHENGETKVVGVIGFDFLASAAVDIDYEHGKVNATQPDAFAPPATPYIAEANLDNGVPEITVQIGSAIGNHFVIDTATTSFWLYPSFWKSQPALTLDPSRFKWADGKMMSYLNVSFAQVEVAGILLRDFGALLHADDGDSPTDRDGELGFSFLSMFHVYFDYPHQRVYFQPSSWLEKEMQKPASSSGSLRS